MVSQSGWCNYLKKGEIKAGTSLGKLLDIHPTTRHTSTVTTNKTKVEEEYKVTALKKGC